MPLPQFKVRKVNGVTEIKLADDPAIRQEFARAMTKYAPLVSELNPSIPSFDQLKGTEAVREFIDEQMSAGEAFTFQLRVTGVENVILEKDVLIVNQSRKVCAVSRWRPGEGVTFEKS